MSRKSELTSFNNSGDGEITVGEESGLRSQRVTPEDIRGKMNFILAADDEARQLDEFIDNPSIVLAPEVLEVYHIINRSAKQNVSIMPYIEDALTRATQGVGLDVWLVRLLIPAYKDKNLSPGLHQKVKHAIDSQPLLYSDLQVTQGGRRRYKSKRHKRTSKKHKRTYKKYKRTSKKHK